MGGAEISSRALQMLRSQLEQRGIGLARAAAPSRAAAVAPGGRGGDACADVRRGCAGSRA
jgi:hypothetical protein